MKMYLNQRCRTLSNCCSKRRTYASQTILKDLCHLCHQDPHLRSTIVIKGSARVVSSLKHVERENNESPEGVSRHGIIEHYTLSRLNERQTEREKKRTAGVC